MQVVQRNLYCGIKLMSRLVFQLSATRLARASSQCKGGVFLVQLRSGCSKYTFRYTYHVTTCLPLVQVFS